jgi:hypothetical protein
VAEAGPLVKRPGGLEMIRHVEKDVQPSRPFSRPRPLAFTPPDGVEMLNCLYMLTHTARTV